MLEEVLQSNIHDHYFGIPGLIQGFQDLCLFRTLYGLYKSRIFENGEFIY